SSGDNARTTQQASRLEKILDEVIMSFSPWVQQQYLVRAEKDKAKQQRGMRLIKIHLAPLYRFLGGEAVYKAVSFCNAEFLARWESGDVDPDSVLQRCRGVFPTVLETVVIIRSAAAATLGASSAKTSNKASHRGHSKSGDGDVAQRSRSGSLLGGGSTLADRR
ncbi:WD repeat-containing protein 12, partial [Perkinsus olseni]